MAAPDIEKVIKEEQDFIITAAEEKERETEKKMEKTFEVDFSDIKEASRTISSRRLRRPLSPRRTASKRQTQDRDNGDKPHGRERHNIKAGGRRKAGAGDAGYPRCHIKSIPAPAHSINWLADNGRAPSQDRQGKTPRA